MDVIFLLLCISLSIVKANEWIIIPKFVVIVCWVISIICTLVYSYARGKSANVNKQLVEKIKELEGK